MNTKFYIFLLIILSLSGCLNKKAFIEKQPIINDLVFEEETIVMYSYNFKGTIPKLPVKDSITIKINIYEAKKILYPILDSIIDAVQSCPLYENAKIEFAFRNLKYDRKLEFMISNINIHSFNYLSCNGFFTYKGIRFNYTKGYIDHFLVRKIGETNFKTYDPEILQYIINEDGSSWSYYYEDGNIRNISYDNCGNKWYEK